MERLALEPFALFHLCPEVYVIQGSWSADNIFPEGFYGNESTRCTWICPCSRPSQCVDVGFHIEQHLHSGLSMWSTTIGLTLHCLALVVCMDFFISGEDTKAAVLWLNLELLLFSMLAFQQCLLVHTGKPMRRQIKIEEQYQSCVSFRGLQYVP